MEILAGILRILCGAFALGVLAYLLWSIFLGTRRPAGASSGRQARWLRSPIFYAAASAVFFGACILLWIPLPRIPFADGIAVLGALPCFAGLAFVLWGRLALGEMYFVSTGFGAQLFEGHRLIRRGPYALVRHPMYFGLILAAAGSLALYQTWTGVFFGLCALGVIRRAFREEEVLAKEFGAEWEAYRREVPMLFPRLFLRRPLPTRGRGRQTLYGGGEEGDES